MGAEAKPSRYTAGSENELLWSLEEAGEVEIEFEKGGLPSQRGKEF